MIANSRGERPGGGGRRLVRRADRMLRDLPDVNGYDSEELMVDAYGNSPQSLYNDEESDDEDSASDASDLDDSPEIQRHRF